jgi:GNAT superfamily N-acetyltransferase
MSAITAAVAFRSASSNHVLHRAILHERSMTLPETSFFVLPAQDHHWRALRMLLPDAVHFGCGCDLLVACETETHRVIAAAALSPWLRRSPQPGLRVALHVIQPWRRRTIAKTLLHQVDALAIPRGATALYAWDPVEPQSETARLWHALGFTQSHDHPTTRVDAGRTVEHLQKLSDRMLQHRPFPNDLKIIPLAQADPHQAAALHRQYLGGTLQMALVRLTGQVPDHFDLHLSRALLQGNQVVGLALVRRIAPTTLWIDGNVLHPQFRGGWGNLRLKLDCAQACLDAGLHTFIYHTFDQHVDSQKFADRVGGVTQAQVELYRMIPRSAD